MIFTTNLAPHFGAFSRALKNEKIKVPLFPGPEGAGNTNGWCINWMSIEQGKGPMVISYGYFCTCWLSADGVRQFFWDSDNSQCSVAFFAVPCVDLRLVSVVFPDHTHLLLWAPSTNTRRKIKQNKGAFVQRTGDQADVFRLYIWFRWPAVSELGPKITLLGPSSEIHAFKLTDDGRPFESHPYPRLKIWSKNRTKHIFVRT